MALSSGDDDASGFRSFIYYLSVPTHPLAHFPSPPQPTQHSITLGDDNNTVEKD